MEDSCFYGLLRYFSFSIQITDHEGEIFINKTIPINDFEAFSFERVSKFIGECNVKLDKYKDDPGFIYRELDHIRDKFYSIFQYEFKQSYEHGHRADFSILSFDSRCAEHYLKAFDIKFNTYDMAFNFLNKTLDKNIDNIPMNDKKAKRTKIKRHQFKIDLNAEQFISIKDL